MGDLHPEDGEGEAVHRLARVRFESLKRHGDRQALRKSALAVVWEETGYVFTNEHGEPMHVNTLA